MSRASSFIRPARRLAIYFRDGFRCVYCRADAAHGAELTLDHLHSSTDHATANLVTCCHKCNSARRALPLAKWYVVLRTRGIDTRAVRLRLYRARRRPINGDLGLLAARLAPGLAVGRLAELWPRTRRA